MAGRRAAEALSVASSWFKGAALLSDGERIFLPADSSAKTGKSNI
jgi:hypothetical protein